MLSVEGYTLRVSETAISCMQNEAVERFIDVWVERACAIHPRANSTVLRSSARKRARNMERSIGGIKTIYVTYPYLSLKRYKLEQYDSNN